LPEYLNWLREVTK